MVWSVRLATDMVDTPHSVVGNQWDYVGICLNPKPCTLNPDPEPQNRNPETSFLNPKTLNPKL